VQAVAHEKSDSYALMIGDARECLAKLPRGSIDTCLTSPPYWGVRDYDHEGQLGLEDDLDDYIDKMVQVFSAMWDALADHGTVWLNVGDKYLNGVGTVGGLPPRKGWKRNKQLSLVPFRLAIALQEEGWWVRNAMVWHKTNAMPISAHDRLSNSWEPVFLLTKNERYYFDVDRVRVPHKTDDEVERRRAHDGNARGKAQQQQELRRWLNSPRHRATIEGVREIGRRPNAPEAVELAAYLRASADAKGLSIKDVAAQLDQPFERIRHYFRTDRIGSRLPTEATWEQLKSLLELDGSYDEAMTIEYGDNVFRNHPKGRNPGDVQAFGVATTPGQHFATMPAKLAEWTLRASLPPGGVCLDPFMGHGTTGKAAIKLGGRFVGVDVNETYVAEFMSVIQADDEAAVLEAAE
jgi:DNA modification methylase